MAPLQHRKVSGCCQLLQEEDGERVAAVNLFVPGKAGCCLIVHSWIAGALLRIAFEVHCGRGNALERTNSRLLARRHRLVWKARGKDLHIPAPLSLFLYNSLLLLAAVVSGLSISGEIPSCQTCVSAEAS